MDQSAESTASADVRAELTAIERLLGTDPAAADARAGRLLERVPGEPMARLFQGIARRLGGNPQGAVAVLAPLCETERDAPLPQLQLGLALQETGDRDAAVAAMRRAVAAKPDFGDAWLALADLLVRVGDAGGADEAYCTYVRHALAAPELAAAAEALAGNRLADAERRLRSHLEQHPTDVCAQCMLADVAARYARFDFAEELLAKCLERAPGYRAARHNYAVVLLRQGRPVEALREAERLLAANPEGFELRNLKATALLRLAEYEDAVRVYEGILEDHPDRPTVWASLGHTLRSVGRLEASVEAYRKAVQLAPDFGEASWNLANLKTYRISDAELEAMRAQLARVDLGTEDRIHFEFAVGKALEDRENHEQAFEHYRAGNRLRRQRIRYDAADMTGHVQRSTALFAREFFAARSEYGADAVDPIFVVGLPRSGSTLVEQILASHSDVEGTMELPHIIGIAKSLAERRSTAGTKGYPEVLATIGAAEFRRLGEDYVERIGVQRKEGRPFFIDKMPNNFAHLGLIHLMLPRARIVDVRRHPMACGFSLYKHLFAKSQHFSYDLEDIGRYYRDYVTMMAHIDTVLPGRVHRVIYEQLVDDTETEIRRLLDYCGLPFEEACLEFHASRRAVSTPSSEQVRSPIYRDAVAHWRRFEPWLEPLKSALGPLADTYPDLPQALRER